MALQRVESFFKRRLQRPTKTTGSDDFVLRFDHMNLREDEIYHPTAPDQSTISFYQQSVEDEQEDSIDVLDDYDQYRSITFNIEASLEVRCRERFRTSHEVSEDLGMLIDKYKGSVQMRPFYTSVYLCSAKYMNIRKLGSEAYSYHTSLHGRVNFLYSGIKIMERDYNYRVDFNSGMGIKKRHILYDCILTPTRRVGECINKIYDRSTSPVFSNRSLEEVLLEYEINSKLVNGDLVFLH